MAFVVALAVTPGPATAETSSTDNSKRPKIGLALSGGGARGAAHVGVLQVLEDYRVPIDYIAGTSMGAIVGGLYASGIPAAELDSLISTIDWDDVLSDRIPRNDLTFRRKRDDDYFLVKSKPGISGFEIKFPPGVLDAWKVDLLLKRFTLPSVSTRDFDDLFTPYRAIACDIETGEVVVLDHGDLALAMRASMSIPIVFAPREVDGKILIDGGVSMNLPIEIVRRMGADIVIAVDIGTPLRKREQIESVLAVTNQLVTMMTRRNIDAQIATLTDDDVFIQPDLGDITTASFDRAREAVPSGVAAAEAESGRLDELSVPAPDYKSRPRPDTTPPVIDEIRIVNQSRLSDGVIEALLHVETGEPLDVDQLEQDLHRMYGLQIFELVYYDITEESGRTVLTVTVRERSWGPNYLQFGVAIYEDYESPNFNLGVAYIRTAVNRLNGEWRSGLQLGQEPLLYTEFFQPLNHELRWFVHARAAVGEYALTVFDSKGNTGNALSVLGTRAYGGEFDVGRELGRWGQARLGLIRAAGKSKVQVGDPDSTQHYDTGELYGQFFVDEIDNVAFPRAGWSMRLRLTAGLEALGSDVEYEQGEFDGSVPLTRGRNTALFVGEFSTTRDSDAPIQNQFRLGGFTRMSGYEVNELVGQHAAQLTGVFYRQIWQSGILPGYAGGSVEYGNVFQNESEIRLDNGIFAGSVFLGIDTPVGPFYFAYGFAEGGRSNFYFFLGQPPRHFRPLFTNR